MNPVLVTFDALYARLPDQDQRNRPAATSRLAAVLASALSRLAALVPDSREGLRSQEHELATRGVRWASDPAEDRALAEEIQAAGARRRGRLAPVATLPSAQRPDLPKAA